VGRMASPREVWTNLEQETTAEQLGETKG